MVDNLFSFVPAQVYYHHDRIRYRLGYQPRFKLHSTWGSFLTHKKMKNNNLQRLKYILKTKNTKNLSFLVT